MRKLNAPDAKNPLPVAVEWTLAAKTEGADPLVGYRAPCRWRRWTCLRLQPLGITGEAFGSPSELTDCQGPRFPRWFSGLKELLEPLLMVGATRGNMFSIFAIAGAVAMAFDSSPARKRLQ